MPSIPHSCRNSRASRPTRRVRTGSRSGNGRQVMISLARWKDSRRPRRPGRILLTVPHIIIPQSEMTLATYVFFITTTPWFLPLTINNPTNLFNYKFQTLLIQVNSFPPETLHLSILPIKLTISSRLSLFELPSTSSPTLPTNLITSNSTVVSLLISSSSSSKACPQNVL
jgi:hypothetical protein